MAELYLDLFSDILHGKALAPIETVVALFTIKYIQADAVHINLVIIKEHTSPGCSIALDGLNYALVTHVKPSDVASSCKLPALLLEDGATVVAGLCSVLRHILKSVLFLTPTHWCRYLLGFRDACLVSCSEVSLWTCFCEVDIMNTVNKVIQDVSEKFDEYLLPADLVRFESHMRQPVRIHNIEKKRQELTKEKNQKLPKCAGPTVGNETEVGHLYAEGPVMTLADIILFPCFFLIFDMLDLMTLKEHFPLTVQWFNFIRVDDGIKDSINIISPVKRKFPNKSHVLYVVPEMPAQSLYKRDPKRYKPKCRIFTRQEDIDASVKAVKEIGIVTYWHPEPYGYELKLDWSTIPYEAQPASGEVPLSRHNRKIQQLENLVKAVLKISKPGQTIVDFCSGCGHLGIVLAYLLPKCHVILLENKERSLNKARERTTKLGLKNISCIQCNLDYYIGKFDIGVALHACGVATDLVIRHCIQQTAAFVCCPCCYGSIHNTHFITYPRSQTLRNSPITLREYFVLGHSADQTHDKENAKTEQGEFCMGIIDTDRCLQAKESGYLVLLCKMVPDSCSPKNNMLVGIPGNIQL